MKQYRLGDIAKIVSGSAAPKEGLFNKKYGLPFIRACHLEELCNGLDINNLPKVEENLVKSIVKVPKDTIIFAKSGMSCMKARVYKTQDEAFIVSHLAGVICSDIIESSYLKYYFQFNKPNRLVLDDSYPSIRLSDIADIKIEIPDKEIQIKTAHALDKAQELIDKRKDQIKALDELVKSKFIEMFGNPITNSKNIKVKNFEDVIRLQRGFDLPTYARDTSGKINVWGANGILSKHNDYKINEPGVITGRSGSLGNVYYTMEPYWPLNTTLFSKDTFGNNVIYLTYLLRFYKLNRFANGTGVPTLNRNLLDGQKIIDVPLELQNQFADFVKQVDKLKFEMEQNLKELEDNFSSLMQRAFKGELFNEQNIK